MADIQTEKAFRKQDGLNLYNKYLLYQEAQPTKTVVKKKKGVGRSAFSCYLCIHFHLLI